MPSGVIECVIASAVMGGGVYAVSDGATQTGWVALGMGAVAAVVSLYRAINQERIAGRKLDAQLARESEENRAELEEKKRLYEALLNRNAALETETAMLRGDNSELRREVERLCHEVERHGGHSHA